MRGGEGRPALQRERRVRRVGCDLARVVLLFPQLLVAVPLAFTFALHLQLVTLSIAQLPFPIAIPLSFSFAFVCSSPSPDRVHACTALNEASAPRAGPGCLSAFMGAPYIDDGSHYELLPEAARAGQVAAGTCTHFLLLAIPWIHIVCGWLLLLGRWLLGG
ncbi:hypothetical protein B0H16DRAFT_1614438 [Mycena metata]|uniref:Uncharacterized protein n=1 Tax=Mycena metata TaxID=1033252 RepID=A0AAD7MGE2_9AGAR|nr:hypothetical protein B0H16DRAFT_1614438 [Mycena metata]